MDKDTKRLVSAVVPKLLEWKQNLDSQKLERKDPDVEAGTFMDLDMPNVNTFKRISR